MQRILKWTLEEKNSGLLEWLIIPSTIWVLDIFFRFELRMSLADAGADVALLALSTIVSFSIEIKKVPQSTKYFWLLIFLLGWFLCIALIATGEKSLSYQWVWWSISFGIGLGLFVLAVYIPSVIKKML